MLTTTEKIIFVILALSTGALAVRNFGMVFRIVLRGEPDLQWNQLPLRMWNALVVFLSQRTVLKTRVGTSVVHAFVAWGFTYYFLVNAADTLQGFIPGFHFLGDTLAGGIYRLLADGLTVAVLGGVAYFLARRFLLRDAALVLSKRSLVRPDAAAGIRRDSLIVGVFILFHVGFRLLGVSFEIAQRTPDAWQPFASTLATAFRGLDSGTLLTLQHIAWWLALGLILFFLPYFPYSKHLHLMAAPVNYLLRPQRAALGALPRLDFEDSTREKFGVERIEDLGQKHVLDAFACVMCNRCQDVCPAFVTGKELSPSALEVNKRYLLRTEMVALASGAPSSTALLGHAISESALWACTACGACVEVCPVGDEPMFDILQMRRHEVLTSARFPDKLLGAFNGIERQGNPWQLASKRSEWYDGLGVPTVEENPAFEVLYWVGCAASFDPRAREVARAFVKLMQSAKVNFAVLGNREKCTGDMARRAGNEYLFSEMATANIGTLQNAGVRKIVATCPHCLHTLGAEYPDFGGRFEVVHHTTFLNELLQSGRLQLDPAHSNGTVTFHDPCYLGRHNGIYNDPREALRSNNIELLELPRSGRNSFCCGAGGAQMWKEEEPGTEGINNNRFAEVQASGASTLAVGCPFCMQMLGDANRAAGNTLQVRDVAEILADGLRP